MTLPGTSTGNNLRISYTIGHVYHDDERNPGRCLFCGNPQIFEAHGTLWRPVPGYEGLYSVSNRGEIQRDAKVDGKGISRFGRILSTALSVHGYPQVCLYREHRRQVKVVHLLVLRAFIGPPPAGMEGCHNDGNKTNSRLSNLRWDTHDSNMKDMVRHGQSPRGSRHGSRTKPGCAPSGEQHWTRRHPERLKIGGGWRKRKGK